MPSEIRSSLKSPEVEEAIDLWFYRPVGYQIARACRRLGLHPNHVTLASLVLGGLSGHLFYYTDFQLNLAGVLIFLAGDLLDSADGQLARMTGTTSRWGRILDGVADTVRFTSIYVHLALRLKLATGQGWMVLIAALAGASHRVQAALAEYYRTAYQRLTDLPGGQRIDRSSQIQRELAELREARGPWARRLLLRVYLPYLQQVEAYSPSIVPLLERIDRAYPDQIPKSLAHEWRAANAALLPYYTLLGTNVRILVMFASVLMDQALIYLLFEIVVLNAVAARVLSAQGDRNRHVLAWIDAQAKAHSPG
jgi:hypothetical protein